MELDYKEAFQTTSKIPRLPRSSARVLPISHMLLQSSRAYAPFMHKPFLIYHPETLYKLRKHLRAPGEPVKGDRVLREYALDNKLFKDALLDDNFMIAPREWPEDIESELEPYAIAYTTLLAVGDKAFYGHTMQILKGYCSGLRPEWMQEALSLSHEEIIGHIEAGVEILEAHIPFLVWYYGMNAQDLSVAPGETTDFVQGQKIKAMLGEDPLTVDPKEAKKYLSGIIARHPQLIRELHRAMVRPMPRSIYLRIQHAE